VCSSDLRLSGSSSTKRTLSIELINASLRPLHGQRWFLLKSRLCPKPEVRFARTELRAMKQSHWLKLVQAVMARAPALSHHNPERQLPHETIRNFSDRVIRLGSLSAG